MICIKKIMYSRWGIQWQPHNSHLNQSKTKPIQTKTKNIAKTRVLAIFWPKKTFLVSKSMYLSWIIQWCPHIINANKSKTKQNYVGYQKSFIQAGKFHSYLRWVIWTNPISNWTQTKQKYSQNNGFGKFVTYSDMLLNKKKVLKLVNSMVASDKLFEPLQNHSITNIVETMVLANFWPKVTCWVSKSLYLSWRIQIFGSWRLLASLKGRRPSKKMPQASKGGRMHPSSPLQHAKTF